jgi:SAM-dependent methyltransferase
MSESQFKDHFSRLAAQYAAFRPRYPAALFDYLASVAPSRAVAWDCACGSGQATLDLAQRFDCVIATDASAQQVSQATPHPRVTYRVAPAEASGLSSESVDLVIVAQALHWFDLDAFYTEARRVLRENGVLAVWTYGGHKVEEPAINGLFKSFYSETVGDYWPPERTLVEDGYRSLRFPFPELTPPPFEMSERWTLSKLLGYLRSWSATSRYVQKTGVDPVTPLGEKIAPLWGDTEAERVVYWPLGMRIGRKA